NAVVRLKQMLHHAIDEAEPFLATALGKFVTDTKSSLVDLATETFSEQASITELNSQFEQGYELARNPYYRFAWTANEMNGQLFMGGETYMVDEHGIANLAMLTEKSTLTLLDWQTLKQDTQSATLLCQLITDGGWLWLPETD
ncbi:MAG: hypothetical protein OEY48_01880, partial [Gammaproteobacteria bacterium]|nr:hypothetical protein [Gammaproteobacteria bacterium]